jgi:hypothetical protein
MVTFERRVGRLVEIFDDGAPLENRPTLPRFARVLQLADELGKSATVIICADLRRARVLPTEITDKLTLAVRTSLTRVEAGANLLPENAIAARQFERVFGAGHGKRGAMVRTAAEAIAVLDPLLTAEERSRLRAFLG